MAALIAKIRALIGAAKHFVHSRLNTLSDENASVLDKLIPVTFLVWKSFVRNKCPIRATALSYTTLLALVPLLAIGVSITGTMLQERGTRVSEEMIERFIATVAPQLEHLPVGEPERNGDPAAPIGTTGTNAPPAARSSEPGGGAHAAAVQINEFIGNFNSKSVGISGLLGFLLVAILLLGTIESTFNDIWGVTRGRSWFRRLIQYWTAISLGPMLIVSAVLLKQGSQFQAIQDAVAGLPVFGALVVSASLAVFPFLVVSIGFALVYKLMPNTQVNWHPALVGGAVGGCFWLLLNFLNAAGMARVVSMSKLYGSLAILPVFLIGLYMSWLIVLFGAQVAYAIQNRRIYFQERRAEAVSQRGRELIALRVMMRISHHFHKKLAAPTILELAGELEAGSRLVARVLHALIDAKLVVEVAEEDPCFAPARPLATITCQDVLHALRVGPDSDHELEAGNEPGDQAVLEHFKAIGRAEEAAASEITMEQLVRELPLSCSVKDRPHGAGGERVRRWERQLS